MTETPRSDGSGGFLRAAVTAWALAGGGLLVAHGLDTGPAKGGSGVVPVITGNSLHALVLSDRLQTAGINVQPIVYPAVPDDAARLRFFLSSTHTREQLAHTADSVAATLAAIRDEMPVLV